MDYAHAKKIADALNYLGVLVHFEVNGTQHRFRLSVKDLAPGSPVYEKNKENIADTTYNLLPIVEARIIYQKGKGVFDGLLQYQPIKQRALFDDIDYVGTPYGRFVSRSSLNKLEGLMEKYADWMRGLAKRYFSGKYEEFYRASFVQAYSYFSSDKRDFRNELAILNGKIDLFWEEVRGIYRELQEMENDIRAMSRKRKLGLKDLTDPRHMAAYKLRSIPRNLQDYCNSLGYTTEFLSLHPLEIKRWKIQPHSPKNMESAGKMFLRIMDKEDQVPIKVEVAKEEAKPQEQKERSVEQSRPARSILLVCDREEGLGEVLQAELEDEGFGSEIVESYGRLDEIYNELSVPGYRMVILTNNSLSPPHIVAVVPEIRKRFPAIKIVVLSGYTESAFVAKLHNAGINAFFEMPFDSVDLIATVERLIG